MRNKSEETKNTAHHQGLQGCSGIVNFVGFFSAGFFSADVRQPQTNKCGVLREIMMKSKVLSAVGTQGGREVATTVTVAHQPLHTAC